MRIGQACLRVFEVDAIALVDGGRRDAAAGNRRRDRPDCRLRRRRNSGCLKELIGQLLQGLFVGQAGEFRQTLEIATSSRMASASSTNTAREQ